ncbi:MAG: single-stranded DNA-binding protein [Acidimicrobiales bacterium]
MAYFVAAGVISDEVVRKETRNGVLATFRLETGAPNNRRLWIDVEAWGQLAGTVAHHGSVGRGVLVSGRLTYKTWRDRDTGESRHR